MQKDLKVTKDEKRLDWYENALEWNTEPATKTPEGFLVARAPVTSVGVFQYKNIDGSTRRELRLPEEVFAQESLDSLRMKPLTLYHHPEVAPVLTPENIGDLQVGSVGSNISTDSYRVYNDLLATKPEAIEAIETGAARGLSCGYTCDIEWTSGTWLGMPYDCIQRNIRYNHVALVPAGRAGDDAKIRMDSAGVCELPKNYQNEKEQKMALQTIHLDGADFQAEPHVIAALDKSQKRCDALEKDLEKVRNDAAEEKKTLEAKVSTLTAERDTLKERLDKADQELPGKINAAVTSRLDLVGKAMKAGVEVRADMSDPEIKKAVVLKQFPTARLDDKDEVYIAARFDCACEALEQAAENKSRQDAAEHGNPGTPSVTTAQQRLDEAKKNYNARMDSMWQDNPNNKEA